MSNGVKAYLKRFLILQATAFVVCYWMGLGLYLLATSVAPGYWQLPAGFAIFLGTPAAILLAMLPSEEWK